MLICAMRVQFSPRASYFKKRRQETINIGMDSLVEDARAYWRFVLYFEDF